MAIDKSPPPVKGRVGLKVSIPGIEISIVAAHLPCRGLLGPGVHKQLSRFGEPEDLTEAFSFDFAAVRDYVDPPFAHQLLGQIGIGQHEHLQRIILDFRTRRIQACLQCADPRDFKIGNRVHGCIENGGEDGRVRFRIGNQPRAITAGLASEPILFVIRQGDKQTCVGFQRFGVEMLQQAQRPLLDEPRGLRISDELIDPCPHGGCDLGGILVGRPPSTQDFMQSHDTYMLQSRVVRVDHVRQHGVSSQSQNRPDGVVAIGHFRVMQIGQDVLVGSGAAQQRRNRLVRM